MKMEAQQSARSPDPGAVTPALYFAAEGEIGRRGDRTRRTGGQHGMRALQVRNGRRWARANGLAERVATHSVQAKVATGGRLQCRWRAHTLKWGSFVSAQWVPAKWRALQR